MIRLLLALLIGAALVYFVFFGGKPDQRPVQGPQAYKQEMDKARQVQNVIDQSAAKQRQKIDQESR